LNSRRLSSVDLGTNRISVNTHTMPCKVYAIIVISTYIIYIYEAHYVRFVFFVSGWQPLTDFSHRAPLRVCLLKISRKYTYEHNNIYTTIKYYIYKCLLSTIFCFDIHLVQSCDFSIMVYVVVRYVILIRNTKSENHRTAISVTTSRIVLYCYTSARRVYRGLIIQCYKIYYTNNIYLLVLHIKLGTPYNNQLISKPDTTQ